MIPSSLDTAIRDAQAKYNELRDAEVGENREKAEAVRAAADAVRRAIMELPLDWCSLERLKYYVTLLQANQAVFGSLMPTGQYDAAAIGHVKSVVNQLHGAVARLREMESGLCSSQMAKPSWQ